MTLQEAINALHGDNELMLFDTITGEKGTYEQLKGMNKIIYDANLVAIEALEKQIPKKPIEIHEVEDGSFYTLTFMCPSCDTAVIGQHYRPKYCKHCGQKLDWGE